MGTVWSLAAAAAGAAQSYGQLLTARAALGAGEAGYGPAAGALLATRFPPARRATVLGAFQSAAPLGATHGVARQCGRGAVGVACGGGATITAAIGPVSAVVVDVVHLALRATAISTMAVVQNLVGLAVGPVLGGWLSDRYGLTTALAVLPLLCVVSAAMFWYGSRFYGRDRAAVPVGGAPAPARPQHGQL